MRADEHLPVRRSRETVSRSTITADQFMSRLHVRRRGKTSITPQERTSAVVRALAGESIETIAAELTRSPETVKCWVSYYRCGVHQQLFVRARAALTLLDGGAA